MAETTMMKVRKWVVDCLRASAGVSSAMSGDGQVVAGGNEDESSPGVYVVVTGSSRLERFADEVDVNIAIVSSTEQRADEVSRAVLDALMREGGDPVSTWAVDPRPYGIGVVRVVRTGGEPVDPRPASDVSDARVVLAVRAKALA